MPLTALAPGTSGRLALVEAGRGLQRRLLALGLTPGARLTRVSRAGGPVIIDLRGMRLGLGHEMARHVWIIPDDGTEGEGCARRR